MSVIKEVPRHESIRGLRIKKRVGEKIRIEHNGEILIIQITAMWSGAQVTLAFNGEAFKIHREVPHVD